MELKENNIIRSVNFENKNADEIIEALESLLEKAKKKEILSILWITEEKKLKENKELRYGIRGFTSLEALGFLTYVSNKISEI